MCSVRPTILGVLMKTPSGGGDMEVHKAMLFYYVVTPNVCLYHSLTLYCGLTAVNDEKTH